MAVVADGAALDIEEVADRFAEAFVAIWDGRAENDRFNGLVFSAGASWREAALLRALCAYRHQTGLDPARATQIGALRRHPGLTRALIELFDIRFNPASAKDLDTRLKESEAARQDIEARLNEVSSLDEDRVIRRLTRLIMAIQRTNFWQSQPGGAPHPFISFKIASQDISDLPAPKPFREIFMSSPEVEGVHCRFGAVARGGLRWSDRRDDFRTEVLGLVKAQQVKNAVIVPVGSKGGFFPKQIAANATREERNQGGISAYRTFINSLLDLTDNLVDGDVKHPDNTVVWDGDDPYLVVAADKGTATFSDIANEISLEHGFWLGDAFASGGSAGYDHKKMGITARGAWEAVKRHFREMGKDIQTEPFTVIGCGDMSGDVFGNGMLLSKQIRLTAAFNHMHIFIDPDPQDPERLWEERKRMFELPRSSWMDYDQSLISEGGGIFDRSAKSIPLSDQIKKMTGLKTDEATPDELLHALLKSECELLWFGGIGTYVKATSETQGDAGDRANDAIRVNGRDLKAKVIGEGANLGITQAGRIEFAMAGGRSNTDFIDNSAGVDCSDNEVNIKIALAAAKRSGKLSEPKRVALLESMTEEVGQIVLEDNRLQALALSIAEFGGARAMASQRHIIETLEAGGNLDRRTEGLADDQTLQRRAADGSGLTRPELAVLLSSSKLVLQDAIERGTLADDALLEATLFAAFPEPMRKKFKTQIETHQLRREIIATKLANRIVNRMGVVHPFELAEEEGAELNQVAAAFLAAEHLFDLPALWAAIDASAMPENARLMLFDRIAAAAGNLMSDILRTSAGNVDPGALVEEIGKAVTKLAGATTQLLSSESRLQSDRLREQLVSAGAPEELAARVAHLYDLDGAVGLAKLASETGIPPIGLTEAFTEVGRRLGLDWAQSTAALMSPSDVWERLLVSGLARDFQQMRLDLLRRLARRKDAKKDMPGIVGKWAEEQAVAVRNFRSMIARAQAQSPVAPAMLAQVASMARNLLGR